MVETIWLDNRDRLSLEWGMTFSGLIEHWPTVAEFAGDVGQKVETVKKWKQRNSIPAGYWVAVVDAAKVRGIDVSFEALAAMSQEKAA